MSRNLAFTLFTHTIHCFNVTIMENKEIRLINLRRLLRENKTAAALAYAAGTNPAYISQILSHKSKGSLGNKLARRLEQAGNKPKGWLDTLHDGDDKLQQSVQNIPLVALDKVLEWHLGKGWMPNKLVTPIVNLTANQLTDSNAFCIEMAGDAMVSTLDICSSICPGDIVIIDHHIEAAFGDIVIVKIKNSVKIRQLSKDGNEQILKALNPQYPIIPFTANTKILGVVTEIRRKMKINNPRAQVDAVVT